METLLRRYAKYFAFGVLAVSVVLMSYVIYEISQARRQFAGRLIGKSITQTESELDSFFDRVGSLTHAVKTQYETGFWEDQPIKRTVLHSLSIINNFSPISSIGIADRRGYELNVIPDSAEGKWLTRQVFVDRWGYTARWRSWRLSDSLRQTGRWEESLPVDTRDRPWFKGAIREDGDIYWTRPYAYTTGPVIGITASVLVQSEAGQDTGGADIVALDLTLEDLNTFLTGLELTSNQNLFLLSGDNSKVLALHNYSPELNLAGLDSTVFISPGKLGNRRLIRVLNEETNRQAFSFTSEGETWWGILRPYRISESRTINIVSVLPEGDFAAEITRTMWVGIGSFILILLLSLLVVSNHNKLHRISNLFSEKNKLISDQKRVLLSEVHHRVKNNLALISAFMELDIMQTNNNVESEESLRRNWRRIKIIAIVQEEGYKSEVLGSVPAHSLVSSICDYLNNSVVGPSINVRSPENGSCINININQALTYGLLINELLMNFVENNREMAGSGLAIEIGLFREESLLNTHLRTRFPEDRISEPEAGALKLPDSEMCDAFITQLDATVEKSEDNGASCIIRFALKDRKGVMSSKSYST